MQREFDGQKVTIYFTSDMGFGIHTLEARLYEVGTDRYAQYIGAGYCVYKRKKARSKRKIFATYRPWMVVLEGWGLPKFDMWQPPKDSGNGVVVKEAKYSFADERWYSEGDLFVADIQATTGAKIVADFRHTMGFSSHDLYAKEA